MAIALALVLIVVGSVLFHVLSPWWWTPIASNWHYIDNTILITFAFAGAGFVAVVLFTAYCLVRFRHQPGRQAVYQPENKRLEWGLTLATGAAVALMLAPGLVVWDRFITVPKDASEIEAVGQQWQWNFRLPGKDGKLGMAATQFISAENTLGLNPDDPNGKDDVLIESDDLHLPVGKPVKLLLRSADVIHDFFVPEFRAKMDLVPGMVTYFWFTPTRTGTFEVFCAELCGTGHAFMRGKVVVDEETDYQAWLDQQPTFASKSAQSKPTKDVASRTE